MAVGRLAAAAGPDASGGAQAQDRGVRAADASLADGRHWSAGGVEKLLPGGTARHRCGAGECARQFFSNENLMSGSLSVSVMIVDIH